MNVLGRYDRANKRFLLMMSLIYNIQFIVLPILFNSVEGSLEMLSVKVPPSPIMREHRHRLMTTAKMAFSGSRSCRRLGGIKDLTLDFCTRRTAVHVAPSWKE